MQAYPQVEEADQRLVQPTIIINNHVQQQSQPDQPVAQPSEEEVHKWGKRVRITSWIYVAVGVIGTLGSIHGWFNARFISNAILYGMKPKHNEAPQEDRPMTRDEFAVYDIFSILSVLCIAFSIVLTRAGFKSLKATYAGSSKLTHRTLRCHVFRVLVLVAIIGYIHHRGKEMKAIAARHHHREFEGRKLAEEFPVEILNKTESANSTDKIEPAAVPVEEPKVHHHKMKGDHEQNAWENKEEFQRHHKKHCCKCPFPAIIFFTTIAHFYFLRRFHRAQVDFEAAGGKLTASHPCKKACRSEQVEQRPAFP